MKNIAHQAIEFVRRVVRRMRRKKKK